MTSTLHKPEGHERVDEEACHTSSTHLNAAETGAAQERFYLRSDTIHVVTEVNTK